MGSKGLWVDMMETRKLWVTAYVPLTQKDMTVAVLERQGRNTACGEPILKVAYNRTGIAVFAGDKIPSVLISRDAINTEEWKDAVEDAMGVPAVWIPGPVKSAIVKVSRKHGAIVLRGAGGEVRVWQRIKREKSSMHEWGMEVTMGEAVFVKRGEEGKVVELRKLVEMYDRLAEMYRIVR